MARTGTGPENPNRKHIVQVARWLFYTRGYGPTSLGDLAREARIPKGNFYYHFRSKDDVLRAVLEARRGDVEQRLAEWKTTLPTPARRLHRVVDMLVSEQESLTRYGCPMGTLLTELGKAQRELQEEARAVLQRIVDFAKSEFVALGQKPCQAEQSAVHLIGRCQGAAVMAHALGRADVLEREVEAVRVFLDELLPSNSRAVEPG